MIILFGYGDYAVNMFEEYAVPLCDIETIVDKKSQTVIENIPKPIYHLGGADVEARIAGRVYGDTDKINKKETISWEEFIKHRGKYVSETAVIGTLKYEKEIKTILLKAGLFTENSIMRLDDWIKKYPRISYEEKMVYFMKKAGKISPELLKNAKMKSSREDVLQEIPQRAVAAEVGVAYGGFSERILQQSNPSKLYAIDIFDDSTKGIWDYPVFAECGMTHYEWYRMKFEKEIAEGVLEMRQGLSWDCLSQFPDDYFDYVYLDAAHDYYSVCRDINELKRVVKHGGIIQFNDYIFFDYMAKEYYGIMPAVNQLINETRSQVLFYCLSVHGFDDIVIRLNKSMIE